MSFTLDDLRKEETKPVVIVDAQGIITYINQAFIDVYGWTKEEALGQALTIIIPDELHDAHHMGFSRFITTGEPKIMHTPLSLKARNKAGEVFDAEHYILGEKVDGEWVIAASVTPL